MRQKKNQKGSTLLMVTITIMFLSVLGTALLSTSIVNINMKQADKNFKSSHYYAESGIEQAYTIVATEVQDAISKAQDSTNAYMLAITAELTKLVEQIKENHLLIKEETNGNTQWVVDEASLDKVIVNDGLEYVNLCEASDIPNIDITLDDLYKIYLDSNLSLKGKYLQDKIDEKFKKAYIEEWLTKIDESNTENISEKISNYNGYEFEDGKISAAVTDNTIRKMGVLQEETANPETIITVTSAYQYKGTDEAVQADIVVGLPFNYPIQIQEAIGIDNPLWKNAIVSGKNLVVNTNAEIQGNVYVYGTEDYKKELILRSKDEPVGGVIVEDKGSLEISDGNVISKYYIQTRGTGSNLSIQNANIFCNSLMIQQSATESNVEIERSYLYTEDDIEHNGTKSNMNVTGRYIGFSSGLTSTKKHDNSSAIVINSPDIGNGSTLGIQTDAQYFPYIPQAGLTAKSITDTELFNKNSNKGILVPGTSWIVGKEDTEAEEVGKYQTGESVSIKNNYLVYSYLFPYDLSHGAEAEKLSEDKIEREPIEGINIPLINNYKDDSNTIEKDMNGNPKKQILASDKADYFNLFYKYQYYRSDKKEQEEIKDIYPFFNPGNGINISSDNYWYTLGVGLGSSGVSAKFGDANKADSIIHEVTLDYNYLLKYLVERNNTMQKQENATETVQTVESTDKDEVIKEGIHKYINFDLITQSVRYDKDTDLEALRVYKGKVTLTQDELEGKTSGIIISDGDITIKAPFDFEGAIITTGNIIIDEGNKEGSVIINNINEHTRSKINTTSTSINLSKAVNSNSEFKKLFTESKEYKTQIKVEASSGDAMAYKYSDLVNIVNWKRIAKEVSIDEE